MMQVFFINSVVADVLAVSRNTLCVCH